MKRIIVSVIAIAFTLTAVQAQEIPDRKHDGIHRQEGRKKHHGMELGDLNLSGDQKTKFKALNEEHRKQISELKKQDNITVKESREKMMVIRKNHHAKVQTLLTPEQKTLIEKKKETRRGKMQEMGKARGEKMKTALNLTDMQSAKLDESRKKMAEKMKVIHEDKSLTEEQMKEKSAVLRKQQKEYRKSILTEEQLMKMKEIRKHHGSKK